MSTEQTASPPQEEKTVAPTTTTTENTAGTDIEKACQKVHGRGLYAPGNLTAGRCRWPCVGSLSDRNGFHRCKRKIDPDYQSVCGQHGATAKRALASTA